jgi:multiple sugar transport system substrate-binding protein
MKRNTAMTLGAGIVAAALLLTGCSSGTAGSTPKPTTAATVSQAQIDKAMTTPTTLTMWSWASFVGPEIQQFEQKYPNIKVNLVNVGQGQVEYTKITNALTSGTGAPDLAMVDYLQIPEFVLSNSLLDLTPYGAAKTKDDYTAAAWKSVTAGNQIVGLPQNTGPMVFYYRDDVFTKAGVSVPKTWAQFVTAAAQIKAKTGAAITDIDPGNSDVILGLLRQAGDVPFTYDGKKTVGVDLSSAKVKKVADLLTKLVQSGGAAVDTALTPDWYQSLANDKYVGWLTGAFGQNNLSGSLAQQAGLWKVAPLPQWSASDNVGSTTGGSATVILKNSPNPIAAYELSQFLFNDQSIVAEGANKAFPAVNSVLNSEAFVSAQNPYLGNQLANQLYSTVAQTVKGGDFSYLPFMGYVNSTFNDTVGTALTSKSDLFPAFKKWQSEIVSYAKQQGFTVK